jgi:ribosome biogenesis GTPase
MVQTATTPEPVAIPTDQGADVETVPVVGDWVLASPGGDDAPPHIVEVLPRWSTITRADPSGEGVQVLVANVDVVAIVQGLDRPLKAGRIERSLVMAWESGAVPVLVLTKQDLVADPAAVIAELGSIAHDVEVIVTRAKDVHGVEALDPLLTPGATLVLIGESGAGKSTLVNALAGSTVLETGAVRHTDAKGRHTTTHRELVALPGGAVIIDTPGLRSLGLADFGASLGRAYPEIAAAAERCRFRDCRHRNEPGCAVLAAVAAGDVAPDRFERYLVMLDELDEQAEHAESNHKVERKVERKRSGRVGAKALRRQRPQADDDAEDIDDD